MNWYFNAWANLFRFKGRACIEEFWWFFGINGMIILVLLLLSLYGMFDIDNLYFEGLIFVYSLVMTLIGIRRFHDLGKSGWNILWGVIPYVGVFLLLLFFTQSGDPTENKFGNA